MAIRLRNVVYSAVLVGATTLITTEVVSRQNDDHMAQMEAWMRLAEPGEQHAKMVEMAGKWKQTTKHWMAPGMPPSESVADVVAEPILGGRFLLEHVNGTIDMGGQPAPFEGMGIFGFNNATQKHIYAWLDNFGTLIMTGEGTADATGKVITYMSTLPDPMSGGTMEIKTISTERSEDEHHVEMHMKMPDGTWFKNMELVNTRVK